ncbi:hypothetical protein HK405_015932 [Cladochytrium tenue]|nr:hypothetical protein HK405_015932 [Cladochytrium tenue]
MPDVLVVNQPQRPQRNPGRLVCARILLILVSLSMLTLGGWVLAVGVLMKRLVDQESSTGQTYSGSFDVSVSGIAIALIVYGCITLATGLCGCLGACTRARGFITAFFVGLSISLLVTVASGSYAIQNAKNRQAEWSALTARDWSAAADTDRALAQFVYSCCGYAQGDSLAYTGAALFSDQNGSNPCAVASSAATYPGCYAAGNTFWQSRINSAIYSLVGSLLGLLLAALIAGCTQRYFREADDYQPSGAPVFYFGGGGGGSAAAGGPSGGAGRARMQGYEPVPSGKQDDGLVR